MIKKPQSGFTIIEVVLVLAIAGLVFMIVFISLPQLQASRRDSQRKSDAYKIVGQLEKYHGNTGHLPRTTTEINSFVADYIDTTTVFDPQAGLYNIVGLDEAVDSGHDPFPVLGQVYFKASHACDNNRGGSGTDQITHDEATVDTVAVWMGAEQGASSICVDNNGP